MKLVLPFLILFCRFAHAAPLPVINADFEGAGSKIEGWQLSGGQGSAKTENKISFASVMGNGDDSSFWRSGALSWQPNTVYCLKFKARSLNATGGTPITGPVFANRDLGGIGEQWREYTTYFQTPGQINPDNAWLRFGQWHVKGEIGFDHVQLLTAQAVYAHSGAIEMGDGETVSGNEYTMRAPLGGDHNNTSRALLRHNCTFNSHRWVFGAGGEVIYKHEIAGRTQSQAQIEVGITWYSGGQLALEASRDGQNWQALGTLDKLSSGQFAIPAALLPAKALFIRLRAESKTKVGENSDPGSFQVGSYRFTSTFDGAPVELRGATQFFAIEREDPKLHINVVESYNNTPANRSMTKLRLKRAQDDPKHIWGRFTFRPDPPVKSSQKVLSYMGSGGSTWFDLKFVGDNYLQLLPELAFPYIAYKGNEIPTTGKFIGTLKLWTGSGANEKTLFLATTSWTVPDLYAANYGEALPDSSAQNNLWWCSSGWKIAQKRPAPRSKSAALKIALARNESEAAQLVLRPLNGLKNLTIQMSSLVGANGATIDKTNLDVLRVGYVKVAQPTDETGVADFWPDPLLPIEKPLNLAANQNHPFWVRVRVPKSAKAGLYQGKITLKADNYNAIVPLHITVWNFSLPDRMTCETAFGFDPGNVYRYQNLKTNADKRRVLDLYWKSFSAHHISPYDPAPLDKFQVTWRGGSSWQGGQKTAEAHSGKFALLVKDESTAQQYAAGYTARFPISQGGFKLSFWHRAAAGHPFLVTIAHEDENGQWMSGRNNDLRIAGTGNWTQFEKEIKQFPPGAKQISLTLRPALWAEDGSTTGQVFFDDVSLLTVENGKELLPDGDFEKSFAAPQPLFDWMAWDKAMERAINEFGFTTFRLAPQGLGGGTFASRDEPELAGFSENTPEYQAALKEYLQGIEAHLKAKGWLDKAFVYWFDEPDPKDYAFVMNGFKKLKDYAPGLRRMLTEQPEKELLGGPNLWCPVSSEFKEKDAQTRMKNGDKFWWYVCTAPKAPYATEFIDHPASEMRVWLWQTWQRGISGILVWESNYWTSGAAYPDSLQNPYADPMSWVSGYSTKTGTKIGWGNGDGRFLYPPENYDKTSTPLIAGPVDSLRWEMLRDGIEDYEYLAMLTRALTHKNLAPQRRAEVEKLLVVPQSITKDATTFTRDPAPIETRRAEIAQSIAALQK